MKCEWKLIVHHLIPVQGVKVKNTFILTHLEVQFKEKSTPTAFRKHDFHLDSDWTINRADLYPKSQCKAKTSVLLADRVRNGGSVSEGWTYLVQASFLEVKFQQTIFLLPFHALEPISVLLPPFASPIGRESSNICEEPLTGDEISTSVSVLSFAWVLGAVFLSRFLKKSKTFAPQLRVVRFAFFERLDRWEGDCLL